LNIGAGGIEAQAGAGTGNHTINSNVGLAANQTWNINSAGPITFTGAVSGSGNLTKAGTGTVILSGGVANTFTGSTTITGGRVEARKNGALGATSAINVTGGTLLLGDTGSSSHRRLNTAANVTLGGGTLASERASLAANTITESVGTLTLTASSTLDFGDLGAKGGNTSLTFTDASSWTGVLSILNWQGDGYTNSTLPTSDHLYFSDTTNLNLGQIQFIIGGQVVGSRLLGNEVVAAIPEPTSIGAAVLLVGVIGWRERRRFRVLAAKTFRRRDPDPSLS
jgi:autotransporter-associated beta strand protein